MTTSTVTPEIVTFAKGVRAALADLPPEEVDDLTEGLEADLAESLAEDLRRTLPDPVAYAAELRLAAGLPGRVPERGMLTGLIDTWRGARTGVAEAIARNPALDSVSEFAASLRPLWWIVRAWLATWLLAAFFGMEDGYWFEAAWWVVFLAFAVVSVQGGRGTWRLPGVKGVVIAGNVLALVALLPVLAAARSWGGQSDDYNLGYADGSSSESSGDRKGLSLDGQPIENIYPYDAAGNKLTGVQLFDVDGKPLLPNRNVDETQVQQTPATLETGAQAYNVYPLTVMRMTYDDLGDLVPDPNPDPDKAAAYANGPFLKVPAVQGPPAPAAEVVATPNE
ncbi:hypothetical protein [Aeromicrobium fastidiosum]|uniref:Uncharacterized protein n=1 Tax=Aeromicrobium fastidiosum TaxID=52699 RepID=A0A641AP02_9ACTN|nr:hypothetical protein [Aeromicrobium fastidiosum]KAA1378117.1 hypothetical protein ESP62_006960 [Aeromicrobium fastidiosum]MBP2389085.1 hypothetical protein [Aeromicrobium fastidiosum]